MIMTSCNQQLRLLTVYPQLMHLCVRGFRPLQTGDQGSSAVP